MARKADYDSKIQALEEKIAKKQDEVKKLKAQLAEVKEKKAKEDYQELTTYLEENNLPAAAVLAVIKN